MKRFIAGATAGAVGTTALNVVTYLDMAARDRPASSVPAEVVSRLAERTGVGPPPEENRRQALGSLSGYLTGLGLGTAYGVVQSRLRLRSPVLAAVVLGLAAMAASDVPATLLGVTKPGEWAPRDWLSDLVPHLAFGFATARAYEALTRRRR